MASHSGRLILRFEIHASQPMLQPEKAWKCGQSAYSPEIVASYLRIHESKLSNRWSGGGSDG
jgi:hypothetical protein